MNQSEDDTSPPEVSVHLFADDPITGVSEDLLDRQRFATGVVRVLQQLTTQTPSGAIALIGPWGSGKSSLLNLVRLELDKSSEWKSIVFNPWHAPDLEGIVRDFFNALRFAMPAEESTGKHRRASIAKYAAAAGPWAAILKVPGLDVQKGLEKFASMIVGDVSIEGAQAEASKALKDLDTKILVVIDDVDRLFPDELLLLFKLVRLVGRLPNVYYLIAFDEETLLDVLKSTDLARGSAERALEYLEKVFQLRLDIPSLHPARADELFDRALSYVFETARARSSEGDSSRLFQAYHSCIKMRLSTPRSIRRYLAQVQAYLPLVVGELNAVDLCLVTFLRTFLPRLYRTLPSWKDDLTMAFKSAFGGQNMTYESRLEMWNKRFEATGVPPQEIPAVLALLAELFLPIGASVRRASYSDDLYKQLADEQRIGSPEYFDRYFEVGIAPGDISDAVVVQALAEIRTEKLATAVEALLRHFTHIPNKVLDKLIREGKDLHGADCGPIITFLGSVYHQAPGDGSMILSVRHRLEVWGGDLLARCGGRFDCHSLLAFPMGLRFLVAISEQALLRCRDSVGTEPDWLSHCLSCAIESLRDAFELAAARPLEEFEYADLIFQWNRLDPKVNVPGWVLSKLEGSGPWTVAAFATLFVPRVVASSVRGAVPSGFELDGFYRFVPEPDARRLIDLRDLGAEDASGREYVGTFDDRRQHALRALKQDWQSKDELARKGGVNIRDLILPSPTDVPKDRAF